MADHIQIFLDDLQPAMGFQGRLDRFFYTYRGGNRPFLRNTSSGSFLTEAGTCARARHHGQKA